MRQNTFEKKKNYLGEMLIEKIIEFQLSGPGRPGRTYSSTIFFKLSKENLRTIGLLFTAKILHEAMCLNFTYLGQKIVTDLKTNLTKFELFTSFRF